MDPSISIIINNYNYGRFLRDAIDSALNQTVRPLEIIVVDDGSTDDSRAIIRSYGDAIYPLFQQNQGQLSAYISGFEASRGDLVLFLDSDDMLTPDFVNEVTQAWEPGASKLHYPLLLKMDDGNPNHRALMPSAILPSGDLSQSVFQIGIYVSPPGSGCVYSRQFLRKIFPLYPNSYRAGDTVTGYLAPFYGNILAIQRPLAWYRIHENNDSGSANVSAKSIRNSLQNDNDRISVLKAVSIQRGLVFADDTLDRQVHHIRFRIASLRLDPNLHPRREDTRWRLTVMGISAALRAKPVNVIKQIQFVGWFILMLIAPDSMVPKLASIGCSPGARPKILAILTGCSSASASKK